MSIASSEVKRLICGVRFAILLKKSEYRLNQIFSAPLAGRRSAACVEFGAVFCRLMARNVVCCETAIANLESLQICRNTNDIFGSR